MNAKRTTAITAVLILAITGSAWASTAYIKYASPGKNCGVAGFWVDFDNNGTWDEQYNNNVYTGEYKFRFDPDSAYSSPETKLLMTDPFYAYCIDVDQHAPTQWSVYTLEALENAPINDWGTVMDATQANRIRELFGRFYASVNTREKGEAFAACLWEIIFEQTGTYDLADGTLVMNGLDWDAEAVATGWLGQLNGDTNYFDMNVFALTNDTFQDFALTSGGTSTPPPPHAPEPVTLAGLFLGVGSLIGYLRRRRA